MAGLGFLVSIIFAVLGLLWLIFVDMRSKTWKTAFGSPVLVVLSGLCWYLAL